MQIRAARAMLDWSQDMLAETAGVAKRTIVTIEQGSVAPRSDTMTAIQTALEKHGIEFISGGGVRPRDDLIKIFEGDGAEELLLNDIYETMLLDQGNKEVLIYGLDEISENENPQAYGLAKAQLDRLTKAGIKERIIGRVGNTNFIAPWHFYRWVPNGTGFTTPLFIYGSKIAMNNDTPPFRSIVIEDQLFADTCRHMFNFAWDRAAIPDQPKDK